MNYRWIPDWLTGLFEPQPQIELAPEAPIKMVIFHLDEDIFGRAEVESEGAPKGKDEQVFYHVKWWTGFVKDIIRQLDTMFDCDTFATWGPLADEDAHHVALGFLSMWASPSSWRVLPHVKECLITLKEMGIQPMIIADNERRMAVLLRKLGITDLLHQPPVLTSSLKMRVEDPNAIIKIAKMCYLQPGEEVLVVGKTFAQHKGAIDSGARSLTLTGPGEVTPRFTGYRWEPHYGSVRVVHSIPDLIEEIKYINRPRLWNAEKGLYYRIVGPETAKRTAIALPKEDDTASLPSPTDTTDSANATDSSDTSPPSPTTPPLSPGASSTTTLESAPVVTPEDTPAPTRQNSLDKEKRPSSGSGAGSFAMAESAVGDGSLADSFGSDLLFLMSM